MDRGLCISKIYDAATSESQWDETMDAVAEFTGAKGGVFFSHGFNITNEWQRHKPSALWRSTSKSQRTYIGSEFGEYDAYARDQILAGQKHIIHHDGDHEEIGQLNHRPDLVYFRENFGVARRLATKLSDHPGWTELLTLQFDQKHRSVPQSSRDALAGIVHHIAKAAELSRSFAFLEDRYQAALSALDHVLVGVCIALPNGEIILANQEARHIFDAHDAVWLSPEKTLSSHQHQTALEIKAAVSAAVDTTIGQSTSTETLLSIERSSGLRPILVEITPITDSLGELHSNFEGALIYLIDPENPAPLKIERLATQCGLSEAESIVCEHMAKGWTNNHIADDRNVTPETIKSQIASVFSKAGVRNRSELVRLILKSSPPVS